jgi:uncharacterized protein involved in exopolysaccharide biosynthesis
MQSDSSELTATDLLRIIRASWVTIFSCVVVAGLAAGAIALVLRPLYRAEVLLYPASAQGAGNSALTRLAETFAPLASLASTTESSDVLGGKEVWLATLSSRWLTENFIRERNLLPILFAERWNPTSQQWRLRYGKPWAPTMDEAIKLFNKIRTVREDRRTGLVTLAVEWRDPNSVADWSNDLVARVNEFLRVRAIDEARRSITFLESELPKTTVVERQQIIYRLIESKTSEIMMASARKEYAFLVVDPGVVPSKDNYVRPRRIMITALGIFTGLLVGVLYSLIRSSLDRQRRGFVSRAGDSVPNVA